VVRSWNNSNLGEAADEFNRDYAFWRKRSMREAGSLSEALPVRQLWRCAGGAVRVILILNSRATRSKEE
jgi:hypothetical protein